MLKKFSMLTLGVLLAAAPAFADPLTVEDILVNQSAPIPMGTNIRVDVRNDSAMSTVVPKVTLMVKEEGETTWRTAHEWTVPRQLKAGERLAFDYLPGADGTMDPALSSGHYQLRAVVDTTTLGQTQSDLDFSATR